MKSVLFATMFLAAGALASAESLAPTPPFSSPRLTRPSHFGLEIGGRGILYSLNYDRMVTDHVAVGVGAEVIPDRNAPILGFPVYTNVYLENKPSSAFLTAGATFTNVVLDDSLHPYTIPSVGLGWEQRKDHLTLRLTGYVVPGTRIVWAGVSIGRHSETVGRR